MDKDDNDKKNKDKLRDSIFSKINKIIMKDDDFMDKYITDKKSEKVVDRVTLSKKSISEDTQKARNFLKSISNQNAISGNLKNKESKPQEKDAKSFAKRILEERNVNKNKNPNDRGR